MSQQASEKISQQYIDGGVIPAELVGQDSVSKTYVDTQLAERDASISVVSSAASKAQSDITNHANNTGIHVTPENKINWDGKAPGKVQTDLENHIADTVAHLTAVEHMKLTSIQLGAEVNQNAFSRINDVVSTSKTDMIQFTGGTGIMITSDTNTKQVIVTATGTSTPGPHASSHLPYGSDPIAYATNTTGGLMSAEQVKQLADLYNPPRAQYTSNVDKVCSTYQWVLPDWNVKVYDTDSFVDPANPTNVIINTSGTYLIQAHVTFAANGSGQRNIRITKNSQAVNIAYNTSLAGTNATRINVGTTAFLNAGENVQILAYQDSGGDLTLSTAAGINLSITRISPV